MKKILISAVVIALIAPQIALAAWWNPLSWSIWNIFRPNHQAQQVQTATTTIPTALAITAEKADTKVVSPQKPVADSTQKVSPPDIKKPSVTVPSQSIPTLAPSCTRGTWSCSDWLACSSSGSQTRSCSKTFECPSVVTPSPITSQACTPPAPIQQTPTYVMPDKPIIESFCDNKGNCACSSLAGSNSNCSASSNNTVHVGETLNFTIKVSGEETSGILAFILPQEYDWVKEGGIKPWGTDLTYTKTFTTEDISARYFMYAYIKSSNDNYHRRSSGCNWISYSCDDNSQIIYTVIP